MAKTKILVLGASGMLGNMVYRYLSETAAGDITGTLRAPAARRHFPEHLRATLRSGIDATNMDDVAQLFGELRPDVVINCVGLVKQLAAVNDPLVALPINALLPHRLARLCGLAGARLIHVSTDCVFDGAKGAYVESDFPDCKDLYGRSKLLGEVDYPHAITLRTSIIGHELGSAHGLVDWFLSQEKQVSGFSRAIFSGLPTVELSRVIADYVIPHKELHGVYQVSSQPITKLDLLKLVADRYGKAIEIVPDDRLVIDRSLVSSRFTKATGYTSPSWPDLVSTMHAFR